MAWTSSCQPRKSFREFVACLRSTQDFDPPIVALRRRERNSSARRAARDSGARSRAAQANSRRPSAADGLRQALHRTSPRHAMQPVNSGLLGPNRETRTLEWMPSAPITKGPRRGCRYRSGLRRLAVVGANRNAFLAEPDRIGLERLYRGGERPDAGRRGEASDAACRNVRRISRRDRTSSRFRRCSNGATPAAFRNDLDLRQRILQPQRIEHAGAVGADLDAGADFANWSACS